MKTVYSLTASDEPLQVRYVGRTGRDLEKRFWEHQHNFCNAAKWQWMKDVVARGAKVEIQVLSTHETDWELYKAERRWMLFWRDYCDLLNAAEPTFYPPRNKRPDWRVARVPASVSAPMKRVKRVSSSWEALAGIPDALMLQLVEAERQFQARSRAKNF